MSDNNKKQGKKLKNRNYSAKPQLTKKPNYTPAAKAQTPSKKLAQRTVRHYSSETVSIIKHSLEIMKHSEEASNSTSEYTSAMTAIKTALLQLAGTLTNILVDDPKEQDSMHHRNLLANFFQMPGTQNNGVHLVATSNIEALAEDLGLHRNTRDYHWLMNNGVNILEQEILTNLNQQMVQLESDQQEALSFQHERTIEIQGLTDVSDT